MKNRTADLLNLGQTVAIVGGLLFGAIQLAQFRNEQQRQAVTEVAQSFLTPEFIRGYTSVVSLPDSLDFRTLLERYPEDAQGVLLLGQTFETVGIMVHRGDIDLATVDDFLGTITIQCWNKLRPMMLRYRAENQAPSVAEWFQWLAERLQEYRAGGGSAPAYEAYRDWRP